MALNIINHTYERTIPPMRLGKKNAVLNTLVPLIPFVNAIAIAKATTLITRTVTNVNRQVYQIECKNVVSNLPFTKNILV